MALLESGIPVATLNKKASKGKKRKHSSQDEEEVFDPSITKIRDSTVEKKRKKKSKKSKVSKEEHEPDKSDSASKKKKINGHRAEHETDHISKKKKKSKKKEDSANLKGELNHILKTEKNEEHKKNKESGLIQKGTVNENKVKEELTNSSKKVTTKEDKSENELDHVSKKKKTNKNKQALASKEKGEPSKPGFSYKYAESVQIEHAVTKFLESYKTILELSPNLKLYNQAKKIQGALDLPITQAFSRPYLKLGAELKSIGELKKEPFLNEIVNYSSKYNPSKSSPILSRLENDDVDKLSDYSPTLQQNNTELDALNDDDDYGDDYVPAPVTETKNESNSPEEQGIPKMPEIKDPAIRARVFLHSSMLNSKNFLTIRDKVGGTNERLEFLGDSILNTVMTMIIYNKFPHYNEGELSRLRVELVRNDCIKKWSFMYGFDKRLKIGNTFTYDSAHTCLLYTSRCV